MTLITASHNLFVEGRRAILPEITGTSYLTGFSQFLFDPDDPLRAGYLLEA